MPGFFQYYFNISEGNGEHSVCCPFPHKTSTGIEYLEHHPSAHVNLDKKTFHCKVCQEGHNEVSFIKAILQCTYASALRLSKAFENTETLAEWKNVTKLSEGAKELAHSFGITDTVLEELNVSSLQDNHLMFPVFMYDKLIDIRTYTPNGNPKIKSRVGAMSGLIIPLDVWSKSDPNRVTLICAGEKDMAVARSHGFNAITITGGENALPCSPMFFKDRNVVILYDNDDAGKNGAYRLASYLLDYCKTVKVCTKFHDVCKEDKEDITDFFNKYHGTRDQLIQYIEATPVYTKDDCIKNSNVPVVSLQEATMPNNINKLVRSNIQVAAISETHYVMPTSIVGEKISSSDKDDTMRKGETREWQLTDSTIRDVLHLIDNGFKEEDINSNAKMLMHIPVKERYVKVHKHDNVIVYKAYVTEMVESLNTNTMPMEYVAYSIGTRLESGKKYLVTYKLVPHPYKGQQLIMIITGAVNANDSVSKFTLTSDTVEQLKVVQGLADTVEGRVNSLVQKVKGLTGYNGNDTLIKVLDLAYHTVLSFNFGSFKNVRGYLDTLIVGESRVGKSSTAEALRKAYELGLFTSLAGNSATIPGLIGGSNKTAGGSYQTKAGLIPQNHKGLIIFEEFGKCSSNITSELTDIRSSNEVRITRISGTLTLPAMVRMIALSNVKSTAGEIKSIASYPNGIAIVTELVDTAEDIARYDVIAVLGDKGAETIDPFWSPEQPLDSEVYKTKIRWVWSRTPEQIVISDDVGRYIIEQANALNEAYNSHIKIFGTEAWKKLARLAIAVAGYTVSTDESYAHIVVTKECVDYAVRTFKELYDNSVFRLKEYVDNERRYNTIDDEGVNRLTQLYTQCPGLLLTLEQEASTSRNQLMASAGLTNDQYNAIMNQLIQGSFVKLSANSILPTERFRLGMSRVNRAGVIRKVGENNV